MDREQVKSWRDRWKAVEEIEAREYAGLSAEKKLQHLGILFQFARAAQPHPPMDYAIVERWRRLRERLHE